MIRALLIAEGSSDLGLTHPLEALCEAEGIYVRISAPDVGRLPRSEPPGATPLGRKVHSALAASGGQSLLFVHRDADGGPIEKRVGEIGRAVASVQCSEPFVCVVPVRETEAWLLLDEESIRDVAGNRRGRADLNLPTPAEAERLADPKARLREALVAASGLTGRRRSGFAGRFDDHRRKLLMRLDVNGPVTAMRSWGAVQSQVRDLRDRLQC